MKTMMLAGVLAAALMCGCYSEKELQVEMIQAELIRIDTINRSTPVQKQQLTWRDKWNLEYVTFVPMDEVYIVGTKMTMLRNR
ncbi:MAG TPA: hypothetical protein VEB63_02030 [Chitinophagaceae bacterium]|nr:hypothetical protein [Chitinophagaceae bacterium]